MSPDSDKRAKWRLGTADGRQSIEPAGVAGPTYRPRRTELP